MSTLVLVRHGQARPFQKDSDRLSEAGEAQSLALGRFWKAAGMGFDEVHSGTLARHRRTQELVYEACCGLPPPRFDGDWNEYDADGVLHRLAPALGAADDRFASLREAFEQARGGPDQNRHFQRMFEVAMAAWQAGSIPADGVEPFADFEKRVTRALQGLMQASGNKRVAVFTSGGPIGLCVQRALGAPGKAFLDVNWRVRNTSLTEFVYSRERFTLDSFNVLPHLPAEQITFR
ncbi:MAG: histidine phosphatase family protein [Bryobacteraceae bacterium]|nr:histidine phosphatase family protein [Bryobacteraceae bacterium]